MTQARSETLRARRRSRRARTAGRRDKEDRMEPQAQALTSLTDHIDAMRRFLADVQKLLAQLDARRRRARGEDGFDGS